MLFLIISSYRNCELAQSIARFPIQYIPVGDLNSYFKDKIDMKDVGKSKKITQVKLSALPKSQRQNKQESITVNNILSVQIDFVYSPSFGKKKTGKANKADVSFIYQLIFKDGKMNINSSSFNPGSNNFTVNIDIQQTVQKQLFQVLQQLNKSYLTGDYLVKLSQQIKQFPNFEPLLLSIQGKQIKVGLSSLRLTGGVKAQAMLKGNIQGIIQKCGEQAFKKGTNNQFSLYSYVLTESFRAVYQAGAFKNVIYSQNNWTIPLFGYSCLQLSLISQDFKKYCSNNQQTVLLKCSMLDNYTQPDQYRQFKASWNCFVISQDQSFSYFQINVTTKLRMSIILSSQLTIVLSKVQLQYFNVASLKQDEYKVDDYYTARLMAISACNTTLGATIMNSNTLPVRPLNSAIWDGKFLRITNEI